MIVSFVLSNTNLKQIIMLVTKLFLKISPVMGGRDDSDDKHITSFPHLWLPRGPGELLSLSCQVCEAEDLCINISWIEITNNKHQPPTSHKLGGNYN